eukprot:maker-scaffold172_size289735-snap-gene-1.30 protein:Tk06520 transcript:maker-scaffold172_size289735-snap-gene-1.30-mRNA-1 annotation:"PREDICTED: uncharacterized protein LOC100880340"
MAGGKFTRTTQLFFLNPDLLNKSCTAYDPVSRCSRRKSILEREWKRLHCEYCRRVFHKPFGLARHLRTNHGPEIQKKYEVMTTNHPDFIRDVCDDDEDHSGLEGDDCEDEEFNRQYNLLPMPVVPKRLPSYNESIWKCLIKLREFQPSLVLKDIYKDEEVALVLPPSHSRVLPMGLISKPDDLEGVSDEDVMTMAKIKVHDIFDSLQARMAPIGFVKVKARPNCKLPRSFDIGFLPTAHTESDDDSIMLIESSEDEEDPLDATLSNPSESSSSRSADDGAQAIQPPHFIVQEWRKSLLRFDQIEGCGEDIDITEESFFAPTSSPKPPKSPLKTPKRLERGDSSAPPRAAKESPISMTQFQCSDGSSQGLSPLKSSKVAKKRPRRSTSMNSGPQDVDAVVHVRTPKKNCQSPPPQLLIDFIDLT